MARFLDDPSSDPPLLWRQAMHGRVQDALQHLQDEVRAYPQDDLLRTAHHELVDYFAKRFMLDAPKLVEDAITVEQQEIEETLPPNALFNFGPEPVTLRGTEYRYFIPFEGDASLFDYRPSSYTSTIVKGQVRGQELILRYRHFPQRQSFDVKDRFDADLANLKQRLDTLTADIEAFNRSLPGEAERMVRDRRDEIQDQATRLADLGFPIRRRSSPPQTYAVPEVRRRPRTDRPRPEPGVAPEPRLDDAEYDEILRIIHNLSRAMELSPSAFRYLNEEDLRIHSLVQLNGQYEGEASAEAFNVTGKTDIIIRSGGRNIFIAEFKYWRGEKSLRATIDQLLSYLSWRDTKTAIVLFHRGQNLSSMLDKIPSAVRQHSNYVRDLEYGSETGFRFVLHHNGDESRQLILTILAFQVPSRN